MKNVTRLKAIIKKLAKEKNISAGLVLQNFMLERLLERVSISKFKSNFILKGGFLIASIVGIDTRATMDMDATIKGIPVNEETVRHMFEDICRLSLEDGVTFDFVRISKIREGADYSGYRVHLTANYPPMLVPLKLDITTGDKIIPREVKYSFKLLFEDRKIYIYAYNVETVLAEKLETVISRGDQNTRMRDYYDVYILRKLQFDNINQQTLKKALIATAQKRGSYEVILNYKDIMELVRKSDVMQGQWRSYQITFEYAKDVDLNSACDVVVQIMDEIMSSSLF